MITERTTCSHDFIYTVTTLFAQLRLYLLGTGVNTRRKSCKGRRKKDARRAIPALCFTEDDIRERLVQEEQWDEMSDDEQREAIQSLMDAGEYEHATTVANGAITEAVGRYIHDAMLEKEERREGNEPA